MAMAASRSGRGRIPGFSSLFAHQTLPGMPYKVSDWLLQGFRQGNQQAPFPTVRGFAEFIKINE